ncbi:MAG: putative toxin-antitoxin system toxin component, PIN family [Methanobacteriota archaeon]
MKPLTVVADTNVIVSALLWEGNESEIMALAERGEIRLLTSLALLEELRKVLGYRRFGLVEKDVDDNVKYILTLSKVVSPGRKLAAIREDQADNRVLECAVEGRARYIVSGDGHLLGLGKFKRIKIVRAKEFLSSE